MALLGLLGAGAFKLAKKAFAHKTGRGKAASGMTPQEEQDLGFDNVPAGAGGPNLPALVAPTMGAITASPQFVLRGKCPRGYSFIQTGPPGMALHPGGQPRGTCVLTKVARALGLV